MISTFIFREKSVERNRKKKASKRENPRLQQERTQNKSQSIGLTRKSCLDTLRATHTTTAEAPEDHYFYQNKLISSVER